MMILSIAFASPFLLDVDNSPPVFANISTHNAEKWYCINQITAGFGNDVCKALPFFYAFTGCDTVSSFHGKGKCSFWDVWKKCDFTQSLTEIFIKLGNMPD